MKIYKSDLKRLARIFIELKKQGKFDLWTVLFMESLMYGQFD